MNKFYTDIAIELCEEAGEIAGISVERQEVCGVKTSMVEVETLEASKHIGKPIGKYATIDIEKDKPRETKEAVTAVLADMVTPARTVLVVGLGNDNVVADSLGPRVSDKINITRHIKGAEVDVAAISPNVLGKTGIETAEIIEAVVRRISPDCVIAVDSLASLSMDRVNTTIQLSNTGLSPGAGVGNFRKTVTEETIGVPVIAIGMPTVATIATVANSVLEIMGQTDKHAYITKIVEDSSLKNIVITPKDIDEEVENASRVIADGINRFLSI